MGTPNLVGQASKYTKKLLSFDNGGNYCCNDQCTNAKSAPECCITVASKIIVVSLSWSFIVVHVLVVLPLIHWDLPKAVALNGGPVTGSCSASGYPRPNVDVIIPGCDYKQTNIHVGKHTNEALFTMNVTGNCENIYCLISTKTYSILRTKKLLIVGECTTT